ncbi:MAG: Phosphoglycerate mutase [Firmicutes bacterium]|nr:Phosphoglycerate mutase [Bacillota bacterium]
MRIGLVRHFEVDCSHKFVMTAEDFRKWDRLYDCSSTKKVDLLMSNTWTKCYCSDLYRAVETANCIYKGTITQSELIREVPIAPVFESNVKLPYIFWLMAGRLAWFCSHHSQPETINQTKDRVRRFISGILKEDNLLIVTHGFLMVQIQEQLIDRGFSGNNFKRAKCGKVYVFEKSD